jgi:shikimate 5-dehydrogenase
MSRLASYRMPKDYEPAIAAPDPLPGRPAEPEPERVVYVDRAMRYGPPVPPGPPAPPPSGADVWLVPEGEEALGGTFEEAFLRDELRDLGATLTLLPPLDCGYVRRRLGWGMRYLELRDDLLTDAQLCAAAALVPGPQRLLSVRRRRAPDDVESFCALAAAITGAALWDWPVELGPPPALELRARPPRIASLHSRLPGESLAAAIARLQDAGDDAELLKLAAPVHNLGELAIGHAWVRRAPSRHQFLPTCPQGSGRWTWYRLWRGAGQRLNFVREVAAAGPAPCPDQPTLYEWLLRHQTAVSPGGGPDFAALLGDPVAHSRTPAEQRRYFQRYGWPVFLITVTDADLQAGEPLRLLGELGLRAAAVTAPRKRDAKIWLQQAAGVFRVSDPRDPADVCNTVARAPSGRWHGTNTDGIGLRAGWQALAAGSQPPDPARVVLWGGGGTLGLLRSAFPQAVAFSARTGTPRAKEVLPAQSPDVVVWAVGRSRQSQCAWPPPSWQPRWVYDLNYSEDSPGREYAARCGARYESGLRFFHAQAEAQRRFWDEVLAEGKS